MSSNEDNSADPWLNTILDDTTLKLEFEDKFLPRRTIEPLADSENYIAALERKLAKIKGGKKDQKRELLQAVEDTCDSYMFRIISSESRERLNINQDTELETPVTPKLINSWIKPEQAVTVGELAELLKNDSLASNSEVTQNSA